MASKIKAKSPKAKLIYGEWRHLHHSENYYQGDSGIACRTDTDCCLRRLGLPTPLSAWRIVLQKSPKGLASFASGFRLQLAPEAEVSLPNFPIYIWRLGLPRLPKKTAKFNLWIEYHED